MALNQADRLAVRPLLVPRIEGAVSQLALYLINLPDATDEQLAWARAALRNTASMADQVSRFVLGEADFIEHGSGISDAALSAAVETAINNHFIAPAPEAESE